MDQIVNSVLGNQFGVLKGVQSAASIDEQTCVKNLSRKINLSGEENVHIYGIAKQIVEKIRSSKNTNLVEDFMQEYDLTSGEGIALMCLAESLLRIPDTYTVGELIRDKIGGSDWVRHLHSSHSALVNMSTWALALTGRVLRLDSEKGDVYGMINGLIKKLGDPIIRKAISSVISTLGNCFVFADTIEKALDKAEKGTQSTLCSFDMLGEAARTKEIASQYFESYMRTIKVIGSRSKQKSEVLENHGISVKLSSLHPRYEFSKLETLMKELYPKVLELCILAKDNAISLCIDAEEASKLESSLIIIDKLRSEKVLDGWEGLGMAVQAYQKRAMAVLDFAEDLAIRSKHKIMIRLVKGAYWDTEIKFAQEMGYSNYPVFTRKSHTDLSYIACAQRIISRANLYFHPSFGTHNPYTLVAVMEMSKKVDQEITFEFQRLHGMGIELYNAAMDDLSMDMKCRIYAPVGNYEDLLPYLLRRLLENAANSSFIHMVNDKTVPIESLLYNPVKSAAASEGMVHSKLKMPSDIFQTRKNAAGIDLADSKTVFELLSFMEDFKGREFYSAPIINGNITECSGAFESFAPGDLNLRLGSVHFADPASVADLAMEVAYAGFSSWSKISADRRASILESAADKFENEMYKFVCLIVLEAGKTYVDAIADVREGIDFLRYYAAEGRKLFGEYKYLSGYVGEKNYLRFDSKGVFMCIAPWNFPFAIFLGMVSAALVAGNTVIAKPSEQTSIVAYEAIRVLLEAGVQENALQFLPGSGEELGKTILVDKRLSGVAFTGSNQTALKINRTISMNKSEEIIQLIAETGGINAMVVDSSALIEQVVTDVITSSFRSAGQRCSSLRLLCVQEEVYKKFINMLTGAIQELDVNDPSLISTDIGPLIDDSAASQMRNHVSNMNKMGHKLISRSYIDPKMNGHYFPPHAFEIDMISSLDREIFGPILHVVKYDKNCIENVISDINKKKFGLTFGIHSRVQANIDVMVDLINCGNIYINRNQIGAVVGVQPFGGRNLSGTGPKAGGPYYLTRFGSERTLTINLSAIGGDPELMTMEGE